MAHTKKFYSKLGSSTLPFKEDEFEVGNGHDDDVSHVSSLPYDITDRVLLFVLLLSADLLF